MAAVVEPVAVEGKGVVDGPEMHRAIEMGPIAGLVIRCRVFEARRAQGQRVTEQVVADDFQRDHAEFGVERGQGRILPVIAGAEPDRLIVSLQVQLEECSQ